MSDDPQRAALRELASAHLARGDATGWFDVLYQRAGADPSVVPWADLKPNAYLVDWFNRAAIVPGRALVIGCGLGDDAEFLASRGWTVTAFDVSPEAIEWARQRFEQTKVDYRVADLFNPPAEWRGGFDLIVEIFTLQALPEAVRTRALPIIAGWLATAGTLFVFARGRDESDPPAQLPWPLTEKEVRAFEEYGLGCQSFEDLLDNEEPPVRRFRVVFRRKV